jgi:hypothetical protein
MIMQTDLPADREAERRNSSRLSCDGGPCPAFVGNQSREASVQDISVAGLSLLVDFEVNSERLLRVELFNQVRACLHVKLLQIIHVTPHGDGTWLVGGSFLCPLTEDEFHDLVWGPAARTAGFHPHFDQN